MNYIKTEKANSHTSVAEFNLTSLSILYDGAQPFKPTGGEWLILKR